MNRVIQYGLEAREENVGSSAYLDDGWHSSVESLMEGRLHVILVCRLISVRCPLLKVFG